MAHGWLLCSGACVRPAAFLVYETLVANTYVRVTQRGLMPRAEPLALSARVRVLARLVAQLAVVCAPYLLFQAYGYVW